MGAFRASLSLDEANRVRLSLGLRPLQVDDEAGADERAVPERPAEPATGDEAVPAPRAPQGPTLGQGASMSARAWIQHARRQAQVHAAERAAQADKEQAAAQPEYTSQDTHGLRVAHDLADLDGHERVLTLRDAGVLDMEEDELEEAMTQKRAPPSASSGVLDKYDHVETLDAPAPRADVGFRLGDAMDAPSQARTEELASESRRAQHVSLDYEKNVPVSDYDTAFKKRKKKSRQPRRVWVEESAPSRVEALVDDDELAASLARARRQRAKASMKKVTPEMVAQSVAAHQDEAPPADGLLFDGTSNFVQQIVERNEAPRRSAPEPAAPTEPAAPPEPTSPPEPAAPSAPVPEAPAAPPSPTGAPNAAPEADASSVASVLQYLRSQGSLESTSSEQREHEKTQLQYDAWLHRHRDHADDDDDAQAIMDRFKDYKPDIKIEYHDEFGRTLSTKEAWKQLSHTFHGTAPGHRAQEKRLRRLAEEQRRERMLAGDTSAMTQAFQARSERTGQAHMVLSVGHHDHAPHHFDLGAPPRLEKAPRPSAAPRAPPAAPTAVPAAPVPPAAPPAPPAAPSAAPPAAATQPAFKPAFAPAFQPAQQAPAAEGSRVRIALKRKAT